MASTLTPQQIAELENCGGSPLVMEDPRTHQGYVLVRRDVYLQARPLFEAIIGHSGVSSSPPDQQPSDLAEWNEDKNARRCELIDKKHDSGLSSAEEAELDRLQSELATHQRQVAPRPLAILELLEEALRNRAAATTDSTSQI
jgi:hypothetical protein